MKDFVIVGAGPIGLYWAARLAQIKESSGLPINIVVIDPRAGNYNRERIVSNEAIKSISSRFSISMPSGKGIPSEAMYIRDFEKSLYEYCESKGVTFKKGTFSGLSDNLVSYKDTKENIRTVKCDMVVDCSGSNRMVLKETNRLLGKEVFEIKTLGKNPHTNHFSCYMSLSTEEAKKLLIPDEIDPLLQAKQLCKLRQKYDWPNFSFPVVDIRSAKNEEGGVNYFIYYEVPDNLKEKDKSVQIEFLKDLLKLKYGFEDIDFTIHSFGHFPVCPKYVDKPFYLGEELPVVLAGGDCQIEPDYRKGIGIESGIERANFLFDTVHGTSKGLGFLFDNYYQQVARYVGYHGNLIEQFYLQRVDNIKGSSLEQAKKILCSACGSVKEIEDVAAIASELKLLGNELFKKPNYESALECYLTAIHLYQSFEKAMPLTMDFVTLHSNACQTCLKLKKYEQCINLANEGIKAYAEIKAEDKEMLFKLLFRKASALVELGNAFDVKTQRKELDEALKDLKETYELMQENSGVNNAAFVKQIQTKIVTIEKKLPPPQEEINKIEFI
ncbi:TPA: hypothetical protein ACJ5DT_002391 [Legionella pneumophila]|uniref:hypothetical protein n=1 Tax=Legionella pneumophila TaxID=446 RepID=UPI0004B35642|nr:hypothetical protein [Legionella pneumophila]MBG1730380.1 hypothetical protein [Legionella pneumophila]MCW8428845.1 hypothetical protein [Legionella pneumophila]HBD7045559.1 hypothetical protein [Legionella pneumophila]HBD7055995.1 hypothetical protein [Legionella pneumophila]HBD7067858.1 hypothetical protein [Legionella pneumophila]